MVIWLYVTSKKISLKKSALWFAQKEDIFSNIYSFSFIKSEMWKKVGVSSLPVMNLSFFNQIGDIVYHSNFGCIPLFFSLWDSWAYSQLASKNGPLYKSIQMPGTLPLDRYGSWKLSCILLFTSSVKLFVRYFNHFRFHNKFIFMVYVNKLCYS